MFRPAGGEIMSYLNASRPNLARKKSNFLLCIFSLLAAILVCEMAYRGYLHFKKPLYRPSSYPHLGWEFTPGAEKTVRGREGGKISYLINHLGFRDETRGTWKGWGPGDLKISFLGDSVTIGAEVNYPDSYTALLQSAFPEISRPVKTVNLGLEASNTLQHLSLLQHRALPLGPDIVILGYFMNDVEERFVEKLPRGVEFLLRHFYFGTFLSYRIATAVRNQSLRTPTAESPSECGAYATSVLGRYKTLAWSKTAALIRSMAERCREKGVRFGVVLFPFEPQVRGVCPVRAQKLMAEFCSQNDIPFLDLTEAYRSESSRQRLYPLGDEIHPNRAGHRVARDAIKKWLASDPYFSIS